MSQSTNELKGLELRRKVCEALGWRVYDIGERSTEYATAYDKNDDEHYRGLTLSYVLRHLPAYESDNGLALGLLMEVCEKRRWFWQLHSTSNGCIGIVFDDLGDSADELANEKGSTTAEAICRALVEALQGDKICNEEMR